MSSEYQCHYCILTLHSLFDAANICWIVKKMNILIRTKVQIFLIGKFSPMSTLAVLPLNFVAYLMKTFSLFRRYKQIYIYLFNSIAWFHNCMYLKPVPDVELLMRRIGCKFKLKERLNFAYCQ